jgi:TolA-binding protein
MMIASSLVMLAGVPAVPVAAAKEQPTVEVRVDKLEHEMRAVQRKVFPGGNGQYFTPDISPPDATADAGPGTPATSPAVDLDGRVNALESQLTTLTGQVETTQHRLQVLEDQFNAYKRTTDARLKALEDGRTGGTDGGMAATEASPVATPRPTPAPVRPTATTSAATPATAKVDPARVKAIAAIEKPVTTDPADDIYVYGFRLWTAKFYPEAETQLKIVTTKYPTHRRASWAQNLIGRTYLDQGRYKDAAQAFYANYKEHPDGERTPDSIYYMAQALTKLNRPKEDICRTYGVLTSSYGTKLTAQMSADITKQRNDLKCP